MVLILTSCAFLSIAGCTVTPPASPAASPYPPPATAWNSDFDIGAQLWQAAVRGDVKSTAKGVPPGVPGSELDFDHELGLDRREMILDYHIKAFLNTDWHLNLDYLEYDESGQRVMDRDLYYSGQPILAGSSVSSNMNFTVLALAAGYKLYDFRGLRYGISGGMLGIDGDSKLNVTYPEGGEYAPASIKDRWNLITPTAGIFASFLSRKGIELSLDAGGTWFKYRDSGAKYMGVMGSVAYYPRDNFALYAGYRYSILHGRDDDVDFQVRLIGPTIGFWFKF